ncbi:FAD-binding protein [Escherichia sp. HC-CC]
MGGLVATRSIGQFSTLYGAIEDMVVGLEAVLADTSGCYQAAHLRQRL